MPMVRKNPLPPGRYWIYIQQSAQDIFDLWLKKNSDGTVTVEKKQTYGDVPLLLKPVETFYVFNVTAPSIWPRGVGFPNAADASVKEAADVVQRPPPMTAGDVLKDITSTASEAADRAITWAVIIGLGWLFISSQGRR